MITKYKCIGVSCNKWNNYYFTMSEYSWSKDPLSMQIYKQHKQTKLQVENNSKYING